MHWFYLCLECSFFQRLKWLDPSSLSNHWLESYFLNDICPGHPILLHFIFQEYYYVFLSVLGLCCWVRAFSSPGVQAPHCSGFSCCGVLAQGMLASVLVLRLQSADLQLWHTSLVAPWSVESSWPGIEPVCSALQSWFLATRSSGKTHPILNCKLVLDWHSQSPSALVLFPLLWSKYIIYLFCFLFIVCFTCSSGKESFVAFIT